MEPREQSDPGRRPRQEYTYAPVIPDETNRETTAPVVVEPRGPSDGDAPDESQSNATAGREPAIRLTLPAQATTDAERVEGVVVERPPFAYEGAPPRRRSTVWGILVRAWPLLLLLLAKGKWLLVIFKFKAFSTFATMLVSIGAYALFFGLPFAIGFVALLFVHEMGHAIVLKRQGVQATAPLFIPFMGAVIGMKELPKNVFAEAKMALGGPVVGSLGAVACLLLWQATGSPLYLALAYTGFWLNLFNLIPVSPLDGGRAMAAVSPWGWILGLVLLALLFLRLQSLFLGLILVVGGMEVLQRWRSRKENRDYYEITGRQRLAVATAYFGLAAILALSMAALEPQLLLLRPDR